MTAGADADRAAEHASLPSWTLSERQLGDSELILSGAFAPLLGFMTSADVDAVNTGGRLADGTSWPVPVTLEVPAGALPDDRDRLLLADPEGSPLAVLTITERTVIGADYAGRTDAGPGGKMIRLAGPIAANRTPEHGSFRKLMISPELARADLGTGPVLAFATREPLGGRRIGQLRYLAGQLGARILLMPLVAGPAKVVRQPESLIRAVLAAATALPPGTLVVPVPLAPRVDAESRGPGTGEFALTAIVAGAYGATHLMADAGPGAQAITGPRGAPPMIVPAGDWAFDPRADVWRPLSLIESGTEIGDLSAGELGELLDTGAGLPPWFAPAAVVAELRHARPPRSERGFVLFLTGLSGSGKSTIARDLRAALAEHGDRRVTLLDGDLVRSLLSAGLTFSRADRDLNIARIGYVAAEIARHGGIAICAPIAPYAAARDRVRQMVSETGDFLLIHVATPVEVCEARDRKGLYAKARAGIVQQFTGVSDPYEAPADAVLTLDTSVRSRSECVGAVLNLLTAGGWLAPPVRGLTPPLRDPASATAGPRRGPRGGGARRGRGRGGPAGRGVRAVRAWKPGALVLVLGPRAVIQALPEIPEPAGELAGHRGPLRCQREQADHATDQDREPVKHQRTGTCHIQQREDRDEDQEPQRVVKERGTHSPISLSAGGGRPVRPGHPAEPVRARERASQEGRAAPARQEDRPAGTDDRSGMDARTVAPTAPPSITSAESPYFRIRAYEIRSKDPPAGSMTGESALGRTKQSPTLPINFYGI